MEEKNHSESPITSLVFHTQINAFNHKQLTDAKYEQEGKDELQACDLVFPYAEAAWDRKNYNVITPMQFRVKLRYHRTSIRRTTMLNNDQNKCWQGYRTNATLTHC